MCILSGINQLRCWGRGDYGATGYGDLFLRIGVCCDSVKKEFVKTVLGT